jgi:hypothetical protein
LIQVPQILAMDELGALEVEILLKALGLRLEVVGAERERVVVIADDLRGQVIDRGHRGHRCQGQAEWLHALARALVRQVQTVRCLIALAPVLPAVRVALEPGDAVGKVAHAVGVTHLLVGLIITLHDTIAALNKKKTMEHLFIFAKHINHFSIEIKIQIDRASKIYVMSKVNA